MSVNKTREIFYALIEQIKFWHSFQMPKTIRQNLICITFYVRITKEEQGHFISGKNLAHLL